MSDWVIVKSGMISAFCSSLEHADVKMKNEKKTKKNKQLQTKELFFIFTSYLIPVLPKPPTALSVSEISGTIEKSAC